MKDDCTPKCPKCGHRSSTPHAGGPHVYYCYECQMPFEDIDDGTVGYRGPDRYAERNERHAKADASRRRELHGLRGGLGR